MQPLDYRTTCEVLAGIIIRQPNTRLLQWLGLYGHFETRAMCVYHRVALAAHLFCVRRGR